MGIDIQTEKQCRVCGKIKLLTDFYYQNKYSKKKGHYIYYNPECKECTQERAYNWQQDNPERTHELKRKYELTSRDKKLKKIRNQKYTKQGKHKEWQRKNPDKLREYNKKAQMHKKHEISKTELKALYNYANHSCMYCGITEEESKKKYNNRLHKDHAINTGSNKIDNCVLACKSCNSNKRIKDWNEWFITTDFYTEEKYLHILNWLTNWEEIIKQYNKENELNK